MWTIHSKNGEEENLRPETTSDQYTFAGSESRIAASTVFSAADSSAPKFTF